MRKLFINYGGATFGYSISIDKNEESTDELVASQIGISLDDYMDILIKYNAHNYGDTEELWFKNEIDAKLCIEYLETYHQVEEENSIVYKLKGFTNEQLLEEILRRTKLTQN